jgi:hypothetical protein
VNEIPGAIIQEIGEAVTFYVPSDIDIKVEATGMANGTFDLDIVEPSTASESVKD